MAVIAVVSIISGLNDYVAGKIFNLGPDVITVTRMSPVFTSLDEFIENQRRKNLYFSDMDAVRAACTDCKAVGASVNTRARVKFAREYVDSDIRGFTAEAPAIRGEHSNDRVYIIECDLPTSPSLGVSAHRINVGVGDATCDAYESIMVRGRTLRTC